MDKKQKVIIAFKMGEHMAELQSILWELYYEDFLDWIDEQDFTKSSENDASNLDYPF